MKPGAKSLKGRVREKQTLIGTQGKNAFGIQNQLRIFVPNRMQRLRKNNIRREKKRLFCPTYHQGPPAYFLSPLDIKAGHFQDAITVLSLFFRKEKNVDIKRERESSIILCPTTMQCPELLRAKEKELKGNLDQEREKKWALSPLQPFMGVFHAPGKRLHSFVHL